MAKDWKWHVLILGLCGVSMAQLEKKRTGNVCKVDVDCPDNAICKQSTYCVCKEGFVFAALENSQKCLMEATMGDQCTQDIQCHSKLGVHSECNAEGACACKITAHFEKDRCHDTAIVGATCLVDENCYLGDRSNPEFAVFCYRGFCTCEQSYSPRDNGRRCVKDAVLGDKCEDAQQCAGAGLECHDTCQCKEGWAAHEFSNRCLPSMKALGQPCDYDIQCEALSGSTEVPSPGAAMCLGGVCNCAFNAVRAGSPERCWHKRRPGEDCGRDEECVSEEDEPGYCLNGHCTCKTCTPSPADFGGANAISSPPLVLIITVALLLVKTIRN